jgi:hypothetical protein
VVLKTSVVLACISSAGAMGSANSLTLKKVGTVSTTSGIVPPPGLHAVVECSSKAPVLAL